MSLGTYRDLRDLFPGGAPKNKDIAKALDCSESHRRNIFNGNRSSNVAEVARAIGALPQPEALRSYALALAGNASEEELSQIEDSIRQLAASAAPTSEGRPALAPPDETFSGQDPYSDRWFEALELAKRLGLTEDQFWHDVTEAEFISRGRAYVKFHPEDRVALEVLHECEKRSPDLAAEALSKSTDLKARVSDALARLGLRDPKAVQTELILRLYENAKGPV